jgi:hypothetical protein
MSAAEATRIGTGLAFIVMPLVFVFAFSAHPGLVHPKFLSPEQLIDRSRGRRLLHAVHGLVTINTALMIVVAVHLGRIVTQHDAGWAALIGTALAILGTIALACTPRTVGDLCEEGLAVVVVGHRPDPDRIRGAGGSRAGHGSDFDIGGAPATRWGVAHRCTRWGRDREPQRRTRHVR